MYIVYILRSVKDYKLYVGFTGNLKNRLKKHKYGEVKSTKHRRPLELVYHEKWTSSGVARRREKYLKSLYGSKEKKRIIENYMDLKGKF